MTKYTMPDKTISHAITKLTETAARSSDPPSMPDTMSPTPHKIDCVEACHTTSSLRCDMRTSATAIRPLGARDLPHAHCRSGFDCGDAQLAARR